MNTDPFEGYIGQTSLIASIRQYLNLETLPNLFFSAMKGSGKSELAERIAKASGKRFEEIGCRQGMKLDSMLYRFLLNWEGGIIFFDELPLMPKSTQGSLRTLTEDGIFYDKEGNSFDFPNLTILGAGTDITKIDDDLIDRFRVMEFEPYSVDDLVSIAQQFDMVYETNLDLGILQRLAVACNNSPRKLRDIIRQDVKAIISSNEKTTIENILETARICPDGLSPFERTILCRMADFLIDGVNPTISRLATALRMRERSIIPAIEKLQAFGYVVVGMGPNGTRLTQDGINKIKELRLSII